MKLFWLTITVFFFLFWISFKLLSSWPDDYIHIIFCDVGQADAILITDGFKQMLIDGGRDASVLECLDNHIPFWDRKIDVLVVTHMDSDHIGGLPDVLSRYSVDYILTNPSNKKTADFEAFREVALRQLANGSVLINPTSKQEFRLSSLVRSIIISPQIDFSRVESPLTGETETVLSDVLIDNDYQLNDEISENDRSIALFIIINKVTVLLTGDLEEWGELAVIDAGLTQATNIQKAGHHGSKSSSIRQFIESFKPEVVVVSSGKNNQYNHPATRVIDLFSEFEAKVFRTDSLGTIEFLTDGVKYWRAI